MMSLVEYGHKDDGEDKLDETNEEPVESVSNEEMEQSIRKLEGTLEALVAKNVALDDRVASLQAEMSTIEGTINDIHKQITTLVQINMKGAIEQMQQQITSATATVTNTTFLVEANIKNTIAQTQNHFTTTHATTLKTITAQIRTQTLGVIGFVVVLLLAVALSQFSLNATNDTNTNSTVIKDTNKANNKPAPPPLHMNLFVVEGESLGVFSGVHEWIKSELESQLEILEKRKVNITQNKYPTSSVVIYVKKFYARINEDMDLGDYTKVLELLQQDPCFVSFILVETSDFAQSIDVGTYEKISHQRLVGTAYRLLKPYSNSQYSEISSNREVMAELTKVIQSQKCLRE